MIMTNIAVKFIFTNINAKILNNIANNKEILDQELLDFSVLYEIVNCLDFGESSFESIFKVN